MRAVLFFLRRNQEFVASMSINSSIMTSFGKHLSVLLSNSFYIYLIIITVKSTKCSSIHFTVSRSPSFTFKTI